MKSQISLTTILICLMTGQLFCLNSSQAIAGVVNQNQAQVSQDLATQNNQSGNKQVYPRCTKNCGNSGNEGGGGV